MVMSFVGSAAPIAAFVAITRRRAERPRTAERSGSGRSVSGGWRSAAILLRDAKARQRRRKIARKPPLRGRTACRPIAL
jgi:hypothetical protein